MSFITVCGGELIFREWSDTEIFQLVLLFIGWFIQFIGILLLLGSHTNTNSIYPLTQLNDSHNGQLVRVSNVDLDFDSDSDNENSKSEKQQSALLQDEEDETMLEETEDLEQPKTNN